jgi:hypothetical protein
LEIGDDLSQRGIDLVPRRSYTTLQFRGIGIKFGSQSEADRLKFMQLVDAGAAFLHGAHGNRTATEQFTQCIQFRRRVDVAR